MKHQAYILYIYIGHSDFFRKSNAGWYYKQSEEDNIFQLSRNSTLASSRREFLSQIKKKGPLLACLTNDILRDTD